jgi:hypothetical protein
MDSSHECWLALAALPARQRPSEHLKKRLVAAAVNAAEQLSARGIAGGAADGAVGVAKPIFAQRTHDDVVRCTCCDSDATAPALVRTSNPARDGPKRVGPILVVKAHRHQKGGNRRIAVVHVARAAQQRLLPTVPVPLAAVDAALIANRIGESVDRFTRTRAGSLGFETTAGSSPRRR